MKAYTFTLAPVIADFLDKAHNVDCLKLQQAIEADGNANLRIDPAKSSAKSVNRFTPERAGARTTKPATSNATGTIRTAFTGDGSLPREFAGWHDATSLLIAKHGAIVALPLPVRLKAWLDCTFHKGSATPVELSKPAGNRQTRRRAKRDAMPVIPAMAVPGQENGTHAGESIATSANE